MSLDDLMTRSIVEFPRHIPYEEVSGMLGYIAGRVLKVGGNDNLRYSSKEFHTISALSPGLKPGSCFSDYLMRAEVVGEIVRLPVSAGFHLVRSREDAPSFEALQFELYDQDHSPDYSQEVQLWDDVRSGIKNYFRDH